MLGFASAMAGPAAGPLAPRIAAVRISAKADYAVRAMVELGRSAQSEDSPIKKDALAAPRESR